MMSRGLSVYLDLLRLLAALQVAVYHLSWTRIGAIPSSVLTLWGHEAVVVFFVLSGFVVRHAAEHSDHSFSDFATSRISRLYTVILPCFAVTLICDLAGRTMVPAIYEDAVAPESFGFVVTRLLISLAMLNQISGSLNFFTNVPYWSLCYEFWYYFLFGAYFYCSGIARWLAIAVIAYVAGRNILLLLPIWAIGVLVYSERRSMNWGKPLVWLAFAQPLITLPFYGIFDFAGLAEQFIGAYWNDKLIFSNRFLSDAYLAVSFGLHLTAAKRLDTSLWRCLRVAQPLIAAGAARSFTLYMMHAPVMFLMLAITTVSFTEPQGWLIVVGTIGIPVLLAPSIENRRFALRAWLRRIWQQYQSYRAAHAIA
jgi:peptidoglycan/LPS O-acetylase OafA/YrhL